MASYIQNGISSLREISFVQKQPEQEQAKSSNWVVEKISSGFTATKQGIQRTGEWTQTTIIAPVGTTASKVFGQALATPAYLAKLARETAQDKQSQKIAAYALGTVAVIGAAYVASQYLPSFNEVIEGSKEQIQEKPPVPSSSIVSEMTNQPAANTGNEDPTGSEDPLDQLNLYKEKAFAFYESTKRYIENCMNNTEPCVEDAKQHLENSKHSINRLLDIENKTTSEIIENITLEALGAWTLAGSAFVGGTIVYGLYSACCKGGSKTINNLTKKAKEPVEYTSLFPKKNQSEFTPEEVVEAVVKTTNKKDPQFATELLTVINDVSDQTLIDLLTKPEYISADVREALEIVKKANPKKFSQIETAINSRLKGKTDLPAFSEEVQQLLAQKKTEETKEKEGSTSQGNGKEAFNAALAERNWIKIGQILASPASDVDFFDKMKPKAFKTTILGQNEIVGESQTQLCAFISAAPENLRISLFTSGTPAALTIRDQFAQEFSQKILIAALLNLDIDFNGYLKKPSDSGSQPAIIPEVRQLITEIKARQVENEDEAKDKADGNGSKTPPLAQPSKPLAQSEGSGSSEKPTPKLPTETPQDHIENGDDHHDEGDPSKAVVPAGSMTEAETEDS